MPNHDTNPEARRAVWDALQEQIAMLQVAMKRNGIASIRSVHANHEEYDDDFFVTGVDGNRIAEERLDEIEPDLDNPEQPVLAFSPFEGEYAKTLTDMYDQAGFSVFVSGIMDVVNDFVLNTSQGDLIDRVDIELPADRDIRIAMQQEDVVVWTPDYAGIADPGVSAAPGP